MLVGAADHQHVVAGHPHVTAEDVGGHAESGDVADVARAVCVRPGDGRQDLAHGLNPMGRLGCGYPRCKYSLMADLSESLTVAAPADLVYGLVADLPRMGEWSPECERVTWRGGATCAAAGAQFIGHNKAGSVRWMTQGVVVAGTRSPPGFRDHLRAAEDRPLGVRHRPRRRRSVDLHRRRGMDRPAPRLVSRTRGPCARLTSEDQPAGHGRDPGQHQGRR